MVESTRLESERAGNRTVGSNPTLSAIFHRDYSSFRMKKAGHECSAFTVLEL